MLSNALNSIATQSYQDFEVVVKDGCPKQPSTNLQLLQAKFGTERVQYLAGPDGGIYCGLNAAIRAATGDILYFMCDDDELAPGALETVSEMFEGHKDEPYWMYGSGEIMDTQGQTVGTYRTTPTTYSELLSTNTLFQPSVFWNQAMRAVAGDLDESYLHASDYDMWLRYWKVRAPAYTPKCLGRYRAWRETHTHLFLDAQRQETLAIAEKHTKNAIQ